MTIYSRHSWITIISFANMIPLPNPLFLFTKSYFFQNLIWTTMTRSSTPNCDQRCERALKDKFVGIKQNPNVASRAYDDSNPAINISCPHLCFCLSPSCMFNVHVYMCGIMSSFITSFVWEQCKIIKYCRRQWSRMRIRHKHQQPSWTRLLWHESAVGQSRSTSEMHNRFGAWYLFLYISVSYR